MAGILLLMVAGWVVEAALVDPITFRDYSSKLKLPGLQLSFKEAWPRTSYLSHTWVAASSVPGGLDGGQWGGDDETLTRLRSTSVFEAWSWAGATVGAGQLIVEGGLKVLLMYGGSNFWIPDCKGNRKQSCLIGQDQGSLEHPMGLWHLEAQAQRAHARHQLGSDASDRVVLTTRSECWALESWRPALVKQNQSKRTF